MTETKNRSVSETIDDPQDRSTISRLITRHGSKKVKATIEQLIAPMRGTI